jgi:hypothetical protein
MNIKVFYFACLFVVVASLLGFVTMYNDMEPIFLLVTAVLATFSIFLYLIILLTSKNKKSAYQYTFALLGLVFSIVMIDYANNGTPTHIGGMSLYTLKVTNVLFLFFFAILAFIVFGQLSMENSRSSSPVTLPQSTDEEKKKLKIIQKGLSTNKHLTGLSELKDSRKEPVSFSHAFNHGLCRSVTTPLFDLNDCFV